MGGAGIPEYHQPTFLMDELKENLEKIMMSCFPIHSAVQWIVIKKVLSK